ncbi:MAG: porin family protein [Chitinophagaceae bacterium]
MKKILVLIVLLMGYFSSFAQVRLGLIAGGVFAKTSGKSSKGRAGGYLGAEADLKLGRLVSLRPQLKYIMKGESISSEGKGGYNYLELPVNLVYFIPTTIGRLSIGGGPAVAYLMSGSWTALDGVKEPIDFKYDKVNKLDIGLNAVASLEINRNFFFSVNYTYGFLNVWSAEYVGNNKNRSIGLGVGVTF